MLKQTDIHHTGAEGAKGTIKELKILREELLLPLIVLVLVVVLVLERAGKLRNKAENFNFQRQH